MILNQEIVKDFQNCRVLFFGLEIDFDFNNLLVNYIVIYSRFGEQIIFFFFLISLVVIFNIQMSNNNCIVIYLRVFDMFYIRVKKQIMVIRMFYESFVEKIKFRFGEFDKEFFKRIVEYIIEKELVIFKSIEVYRSGVEVKI